MNNWITKQFRDIATFPPKVSLEKEHFYSFIPMDVVNECYKYVSPKEFKKWTGSGGAKFENGDTLFARITPCLQNGKIAQAKNLPSGKGFGSTEFFVFRGKENISDSDFIYYLAKTDNFRSYAIGSMVGASGRQRADATYIGNFEVKLPPLPTQKRIASILSAYDDLIEINLKRIKLLEEIAQRTYEEWFVNFRVKNVTINERGYMMLPLSEMIIEYMNGGWGKENAEAKYTEGALVIRGTDFPNAASGHFHNIPLRFHTISNINPRKLKYGDIVMEMSNGNIESIGRTFYNDGSVEQVLKVPIICASFCKMLRPNNIEFGYLIDLHLRYIQRNGSMKVYKAQAANGINNFQFDELIQKEVIPIPKGDQLLILINDISYVYKLIANIKIQNSNLTNSRNLLLPRLMNESIIVKPER